MEPMQSESVAELFTALSLMHGDQKDAEKNAVNPHFKNKYADLPSQFEVIRPALHKHGLCLTQTTYVDGNVLFLKTILGHKSGQWIRSDYPICMFPAKQQDLGSATSYARRYQSAAICLVASDTHDDDGEGAVQPVKITKPQPPKMPEKNVVAEPAPEPLSLADSNLERQRMVSELASMASRDDLLKWGKANKAIKARMTEEDSQAVTEQFNLIDAELKG